MIILDSPILNSYQVDTNVYAGEYPGDLHNPAEKVKLFVNFGITHFIDLTEEGELNQYSQYLPDAIAHCRFPIQDVSVPNGCKIVYELMKFIDSVLTNQNNRIYIHCWGGVGRTGVIVGCYYVYRGESYKQAISHLRESFKQCPKSERRQTPETRDQEEFINDFAHYKKLVDTCFFK